jgi:hypothetical protein
MAFSKEAKAKWRQRPQVQARQASYKADWDRTNREQRAAYQRAYRARRPGAGALNGVEPMATPAPTTRTTAHDSALPNQLWLFDATD